MFMGKRIHGDNMSFSSRESDIESGANDLQQINSILEHQFVRCYYFVISIQCEMWSWKKKTYENMMEGSAMKKILVIVLAVIVLTMSESCSANAYSSKYQSSLPPKSTLDSAKHSTGMAPTAVAKATGTHYETAETVNDYTLSVSLDDQKHILFVNQNLIYNNKTGTDLNEIYFNIIPQAFRDKGGGTAVKNVYADNKSCEFKKVNGTVYSLELPTPLSSGRKLAIKMDYEINIPNIENRFGYSKNVYNLGNFIITPAVYTKKGWSNETYVDIGDPFYTEIANYKVTIDVPPGYTVAATGADSGNGTYIARNVRDFAFCASDSFKTISEDFEGVKITVYYGDFIKTAKRMLEAAKRSLALYSEDFGKYPYSTLSIVTNELTGGAGGMEYPTLVMIVPAVFLDQLDEATDKNAYIAYSNGIDSSTCHEIAHQWFYSIVGNDQAAEPWLDEGFCRFAEYLYQEKYPIEGPDRHLMRDTLKYNYDIVAGKNRKTRKVDLNESLYGWMKDDPERYGAIYDKGASLLYAMQQQMGEGAFKTALREYVAKFAYGFVDTESFKRFWNDRGDFSKLFKLYFAAK